MSPALRPLLGSLLMVWSCGPSGPAATPAYDFELAAQRHFLAAPYPSDLLLNAQGTIALGKMPLGDGPAASIFEGYVRRLSTSVHGFGLSTAIYQQLSLPLDHRALDAMNGRSEPRVDDPILLLPFDASGAANLVPLELRFVESANGDPTLLDNVLSAIPRFGHPLRGATRYLFVVRSSLRTTGDGPIQRDPAFDRIWTGADDARASALDIPGAQAALARMGIDPKSKEIASATVFTTQDVAGELQAIQDRVRAASVPEDLQPRGFKEVVRVEHFSGMTTGHQKPDCVLKLTYADGTTSEDELDPEETPAAPLDTTSIGFPYRVFEATLRTRNLQGLAHEPYGSPGLGLLGDASNDSGQIHFERGADGRPSVISIAEPEDLRVVIQVPKDTDQSLLSASPVIIFDHGTGGTAYNAVINPNAKNRSRELLDLWAQKRAIVVSRDQPLFGRRYPQQIDLGYNIFLVAYNIANITAFRDVLRQSTADNQVLTRFVKERMNDAFVQAGFARAGVADPTRVLRFGHSLGSVTTHLGVVAEGTSSYTSSLVAGSGGLLTLFLLDSGLLSRLASDAANLGGLLSLLKIDPAVGLTPRELIGGLAGIPPGPARTAIGRDHPILTLAQTILDPADPMSFARDLHLPITLVRSPGDRQVPNSATDALTAALPELTVVPCEVSSDYDPHQCVFREDAGLAAVRDWLARELP